VRGRPEAPGAGSGGVAAGQEVPVPAQYRVRAHQEPELAECVAWEAVQECGQECPVGGGEPRPGIAQLSFQHGDLVAQHQDLGVLVPVAHREQPK
jgi:hypothetical protein